MLVLGLALLTQVGQGSLLIVVASSVIMMAGFGMVVTLTSDMIIAAAPDWAGAVHCG